MAGEHDDGTRLHAYKHSDTRAYLILDDDGDSWEYLGRGRYRRMRHSEAIEFVRDSMWLLNHATKEEREAVKHALDAAWKRGNGDNGAGAHILPCSPASGWRQLPDATFIEEDDDLLSAAG